MTDLWWKTPSTLVLSSVSLYQRSRLIFLSSVIDSVILALNDVVRNSFYFFLSFLTIHYGPSNVEITFSDMKDHFYVYRIHLNPLRPSYEYKQ